MKTLSIILITFLSAVTSALAYAPHNLWLEKLGEAPLMPKTPLDVANAELSTWSGIPVKLEITPALGPETFVIIPATDSISIIGGNDCALMYGVYRLKMAHAAGHDIDAAIAERPAAPLRMLNHWDNLDGTIERGYAGHSIWNWAQLPDSIDKRYQEYARANASIGINATVLNNVNASPLMLTTEMLQKVAAIADVLRPYGIRVFLSVNFASPMALGYTETADPLDQEMAAWWQQKADEIYSLIPDFGGFLVKANSEGQPGPCDFDRTHAEGANMLANALQPHGGSVIWRAFVYSPTDADRAKQAYNEFKPLDGLFADNVVVQVKNGPIDFQPREPYSPLFDGLEHTKMSAELQITQEYLGHSNHLVFLAPQWSEFFSYVDPPKLSVIAGVSNIGDSESWTGHPFAQANWYAFGRQAWNPALAPEEIADEWLQLSMYGDTLPPDSIHDSIKSMMLNSYEAAVDYMMPMGLHHIFAFGHHYGPEPWCDVEGARADWLPKYYHQADSRGLGFDRTPAGSNAIEQYDSAFVSQVCDMESCPEEFLLWFHHAPWTLRLANGDTLWDNLCRHYQTGVDAVATFLPIWAAAKPWIDSSTHDDVTERLSTQYKDAHWWKDACILYFQQFSGLPIPQDVSHPTKSLEELEKICLDITNYESPTPVLLDSQREY